MINILGNETLNEAYADIGNNHVVLGMVLNGKEAVPIIELGHVNDRVKKRLDAIMAYDPRFKFNPESMKEQLTKDIAKKGLKWLVKARMSRSESGEGPVFISRFVYEVKAPNSIHNVEIAFCVSFNRLRLKSKESQPTSFFKDLIAKYKMKLGVSNLLAVETLATFCSTGERGYRAFSDRKNKMVEDHIVGRFEESEQYVRDLIKFIKEVSKS